jgi:type 1 glutamine amidotransferase
LPIFAKELERLGFEVTLINGEGDPEKKTENVLPGIKALDDADVAIFYMRFLNLPESEWSHIEDYIKSGKPVIGMRTANHAFKFAADDSRSEWNDSFGRRVIGTPYVAHQSTRSNINVVKKHVSHEVLTGVSATTWESPAKLYLTRLEPGCVPILTGDGEGKPRLLENPFGTMNVNEYETDIVAWTWENEWGAKVFATSLGHAGDFAEESFTRMLVNGVFWAVDREPPAPDEKIATFEIEMEVPSKYRERK